MGSIHNSAGQQVLATRPAHPAALLFPKMSEDELSNLSEDIQKNGLLESIVLYQGQVLDGLNRLAACERAGVEPHFVEIAGDLPSPTIYVLSKNLHRRHLTVSQRAAIAAETVPLLHEEAKKRQGKRTDLETTFTPDGTNVPIHANELAAKELHVGERTVARAVKIKRENPEAFERVKRGEVTVNEASGDQDLQNDRRREKSEKEQAEPYEPKTDSQRKKAEGQKQRMVSALSTIASLCRGLNEELDLRVAISVCSNEDIVTWASHARDAAKHLRTFTSNLERNT